MTGLRAPLVVIALATCLGAGPALADTIGARLGGLADEKLNRAIVLLGQKNFQQADAILQEVLQKDPSQVYALLARAQVAVSDNRLADADRGIADMLGKNPNLPEAHAMKGVILLLQKRPDDARLALRRALDLQPRYATPRLYLGMIARAKGEYAGAAAEYKALTQAAPGLPAGYLGEAEAQMMLRNVPEAFRILERWKTVPGAGAVPSQVIANLHLVRGEHAEAIRELQGVLAKTADDSVTRTYLGDAYLAAGDKQKAAEHYRLAIKADARNAIANNNLAWLLAEQTKDLDEALRLAQAATRLEPGYVDAFDTLGWIQFRRGDFADAVAVLTKARKLAPDRLDIAAHLGLAYARSGSRTQALPELRRALAARPPLPNRAELERVVAELSASPPR